MTPADIDRVFGRGRLRMVTGDHVEVFREAALAGERRRYTKRFLATPEGDFREWTEREWRILARLVGHGVRAVPDVVQFDRGAADRPALVQTFDAGVTVDHWATLLPLERDGSLLKNVFEDCAHWWALARHCLIALDAIHELRLVHLDLKADNVCIPVGPVGFDPHDRAQALRPSFDGLTLIDFAFSLVSGEPLESALPIAQQADYEYQSPRLLRALEAGRDGDLAPTRLLDWRCDLFSLAAMLWRYLPELDETTRGAWTRPMHAKARALARRLVEAHDAELPAQRPHAALIALASEPLEQPNLRLSLQRGWSLALDGRIAGDASRTPVTRIALPIAPTGPTAAIPAPTPAATREAMFADVGDAPLRVDPTDVAARAANLRRRQQPRLHRVGWIAGMAVAGLAVAGIALVGPLQRVPRAATPASVTTAPAHAEPVREQAVREERVAARVSPATQTPSTSAAAPADSVARAGAAAVSEAPRMAAAPPAVVESNPVGTAGAALEVRIPSLVRKAPAPSRVAVMAPAGAKAAAVPNAGARSAPAMLNRLAHASSGANARSGSSAARAPRALPPSLPMRTFASRDGAALVPWAVAGRRAPRPVVARGSAARAPTLLALARVPARGGALAPAASLATTPAAFPASGAIIAAAAMRDVAPAPRSNPSLTVTAPTLAIASMTPAPATSTASLGAVPTASGVPAPERIDDLAARDFLARANDVMANHVPRLAQRAERLVSRVLFFAGRSTHVIDDDEVRAAAAAIDSGPPDTLIGMQVSTRDAQVLNDAARAEYARHGGTREAMMLQVRAFGANPLDAEAAGHLAFLLLRQRPPQPEAARQLALHALTLHGARYPEGRIEDWATLAIASALSGRDRDARNALLVTLALASNVDHQCKAALDVFALYGERLRAPVEAMLASARASGRSRQPGACEWPSRWAANDSGR